MKTVLVVQERAADLPVPDFDFRTPMQVARCPNVTGLAEKGIGGTLAPRHARHPVRPHHLMAHLLGIDPALIGDLRRAPLELRATDGALSEQGMVFRGDFVTYDGSVLSDAQLGMGYDETRLLVAYLNSQSPPFGAEIVLLGEGKVLVRFPEMSEEPPDDLNPLEAVGIDLEKQISRMSGAHPALALMDWVGRNLEQHEINEVRLGLGENPANGLWLWSGGHPVQSLMPFDGQKISGCVMSRDASALGLGRACELETLSMADPYAMEHDGPVFDVKQVVHALRSHDVLMVYVPAPDEIRGFRGPQEKVRKLEAVDYHVLGPLVELLKSFRPYRIMVISAGIGCSMTGETQPGKLPFVLAGEALEADSCTRWDETSCGAGLWSDLPLERIAKNLWSSD
jgi:2,3-bisphosphoglycerate-independent phosphoglycerate mutase